MQRSPKRHRTVRGAVVVSALGLAYLVGHDGAAGWRCLRVVAVAGLAAGVLGGLRTSSRTRRGALEWIVGAPLVAVGLGIALPHLSKTGMGATAAAGVGVLVGGVVLGGGAAAAILGAARAWHRPFVAILLLGSLLVTALSLGQAVAATNVPRTGIGERDPGDLGLAFREVRYPAGDGVLLSAWYVPSRNGAAVVVLHGAGSTRAAGLAQAEVLATHGYGVLLPDARGHGRSAGRAMDFGWYGDADVRGAVSFLEAQPDVTHGRIGALGLSMGGEEAIGAAATDRRLRAVVAEGATNRVRADKAWLPDEHGWPGTLQQGVDWLTYGATDLLSDASPPVSLRAAVAAAAPRPVLLIAGGDVPDEEPASRHIAGGSPGTVQVWVAPGAAHTGALRAHPEEWVERVTAFFAASLRPDASAG